MLSKRYKRTEMSILTALICSTAFYRQVLKNIVLIANFPNRHFRDNGLAEASVVIKEKLVVTDIRRVGQLQEALRVAKLLFTSACLK